MSHILDLSDCFIVETSLFLTYIPQKSEPEGKVLYATSCGTDLIVGAHGLSSCMACRSLVLRSGIKPMFTMLASGFLTAGPPGKSPVEKFSFITWELIILAFMGAVKFLVLPF